MIQQKTPKKIKGARKKLSAQRKAEAARKNEHFDAEALKVGETYYIPQHIAFSSPEIAELIKNNPAVDIRIIASSSVGKLETKRVIKRRMETAQMIVKAFQEQETSMIRG